MGDQFVQVPPDSAGKKIDVSELTVNAQTVERQRIVIADPTSPTGLAGVGANGLKVDPSGVTQPVSGTFFQATQPVSLTSLPSLAAGSAVIGHVINDAGTAVIGHVIVDSAPTTAVTGTFWQPTQPISATGLPLPSNAAQETSGNLATIATNTTGAAQDSSLATLDADLKSSQPRAVTQVTSPWVVQENSGNLATIATQTRNDAQIIDCLNSILAQLKLLNLNFSSVCTPGSVHQDQDSFLMDILPTVNN